MAFYRVTIWQRDGKVNQGIRELDNTNIDYATNYFRGLALKAGIDIIDIEAAMLSNKSTAVKDFIEAREKRRKQAKERPSSPPVIHGRRKDDYSGPKVPLGERKKE